VTQLRIIHFDSLAALRACAEAWDDLWRRSDATLPSLRAELLAQWVEQFAQPQDFHAIGVEADGQLVVALPLVRRKVARLFDAAAMPCNEWSSSGDLLLDATADGDSALDVLAAAIGEMPWSLLWLDEAELDAPRWQRFEQSLVRAGMTVAAHRRWQVGRVAINDHDWPAYKGRWSRKHRQAMAQALRRLAERGDVRLSMGSQLAPDEVAARMQRGFEVEDRSWKGAAGTSVLRSPGMAQFFVRQAQQAAQWGQLELALLHCSDRPVAFSYGLTAKGVFHSMKVGYDPEFAAQHPGQLLRYHLLERFFAEPDRTALDFQGPITAAHAAWLPALCTVGRLAVGPRSRWGRMAVQAYKNVWPCIRVLKGLKRNGS
jgi:CelD/BcsL family acetyltransferase involved in cellulose biosynthesis